MFQVMEKRLPNDEKCLRHLIKILSLSDDDGEKLRPFMLAGENENIVLCQRMMKFMNLGISATYHLYHNRQRKKSAEEVKYYYISHNVKRNEQRNLHRCVMKNTQSHTAPKIHILTIPHCFSQL
jgi:hypothetical protein